MKEGIKKGRKRLLFLEVSILKLQINNFGPIRLKLHCPSRLDYWHYKCFIYTIKYYHTMLGEKSKMQNGKFSMIFF